MNQQIFSDFGATENPEAGDMIPFQRGLGIDALYRFITLDQVKTYVGNASATWGAISGTLSNQTDLQNALNLKAPISGASLVGATVNGVIPQAGSIGFSISGGITQKTLNVIDNALLSGVNTGNVTLGTGNGLLLSDQVLSLNYATALQFGSVRLDGTTIIGSSGVISVNSSAFSIAANQITGILGISSGGTGTASPTLIAGSNITISGTWPNQAIAAAGSAPGGSTGQVQFNNAGTFSGAAALAYASSGTHLTVTALSATDKTLVVKGAASQIANLTEWQNSSGTAGARITSSRDFSRPNGSASEQFGASASAAGANSVAIGNGVTVSGNNSVGIGTGVNTGTSSQVIAIGNYNNSSNYSAVFVMGINAIANNSSCIVIGNNASGNFSSLALGDYANANAVYGIAIGGTAIANHQGAVSIGRYATSTTQNDFTIGIGEFGEYKTQFRVIASTLTARSQEQYHDAITWISNVDATRTSRSVKSIIVDGARTEFMRAEGASGTAGARLGFFGSAATAKPTVSGSRASGAALVSLLSALSSLGLITDSTTA
jgi:hypothetical protein